MTAIKRNLVSADIEKKILTGLIVSDSFNKEVQKMIKKQYFKVSYIRTIFDWTQTFYNSYKECPGRAIQDIYEVEKENLKEADANIIKQFLENLSEEYQTKAFNVEYLIDQTKIYFRERSLHLLAEEIQGRLAKGKLDDAEEVVKDYSNVSQSISNWFNPFDKKNIEQIFNDDNSDRLFKFPDELGEMAGWMERDWLVAFMAPMKRGKCINGNSLVLLENGQLISIRDIVKSNKKPIIISLNEKTQRFEKVQVSELFDNGMKDCWAVSTRTGRRVSTTLNHQYLTPDGWKYLEDIKVGDFIAVPKKMDFWGDYDLDESLVRFIAYMMADGGCTDAPVFTKSFEEIGNDFERCCDKLGITYTKKDICWLLKKAKPILREFGLQGCKSIQKVIPQQIMNASKETIKTFLKVFFTCDGSVFKEYSSQYDVVELSLGSKKLIDQISHLLIRFGVVHKKVYSSSTCNGKEFDSWRISINDQENVNLFFDEIGFEAYKYRDSKEVKIKRSFLDKFPFQIAKGFRDELKQECNARPAKGFYPKGKGFYDRCGKNEMTSIAYSINKKRSIMRQSFSKTKGTKVYDKYMNSDVLWDEVLFIEYDGKIDTYDLAVPEHHNFIADDCIVHNSWFLQELTVHALTCGLKVAYFSLEMNKKAVSKRIYKRIATLASDPGEYNFPVFDCERNQDDSCKKEERVCSVGIKAPGATTPSYKKIKGYRPCIVCKRVDKKEAKESDYVRAIWWKVHKQNQELGVLNVSKKVKSFTLQYGNNLRVMAYPAFEASFEDMESDLDDLEFQEGFVPDVICCDYFDITNPGKGTGSFTERGKADHVWKKGKGLASKRHCLVVTVLQSNRASISKKSLEQEDTSEDIRKLAHVDLLMGLNQTKEEKDQGIMRLSVVAHRHEEFSFKGEVVALQSLTLGQPYLFSAWAEEGD